jgi:hypothetical protein
MQIFGTDTSQGWDKYCFRSTDLVAFRMWGAWCSGMWPCVKGWVVAAVWRNVCRWQHCVHWKCQEPLTQQRASQPRRPQTCENIKSHTVNLRPSFNIRPGHVQIVAHRHTRTVFSSQYYFTNVPYSFVDWIIHTFIHPSLTDATEF